MDIYTTTFTLSCHTHLHSRHHEHHNNNNNAAGQHDSNASFDDDATIPSLTTSSSTRSLGSLDGIAETAAEKEEAVITVCKDVAVREGCVITASKVEIQHVESHNPASGEVTASKQGDKWMVNISGPQTSVLAAKSAILCELADDKTATLKAKRFDLLDSPFRYSSPVRPHIKARLDSIADTTHTVITIPNDRSPNNDRAPNQYLYHSAQHDDADIGSDHDVPSTPILKPSQASEGIRHVSAGSMSTHSLNRSFGQHRRSVSSIGQSHRSFGSIESLVVPANGDVTFENPDVIPCHGNLEPEKNIEIMIEGRGQAVDLARVRVLVMLDEIVSRYNGIITDSRPDCMLNRSSSSTSCTRSLQVVATPPFKLFKREPAPKYISLPLYSTPLIGLRLPNIKSPTRFILWVYTIPVSTRCLQPLGISLQPMTRPPPHTRHTTTTCTKDTHTAPTLTPRTPSTGTRHTSHTTPALTLTLSSTCLTTRIHTIPPCATDGRLPISACLTTSHPPLLLGRAWRAFHPFRPTRRLPICGAARRLRTSATALRPCMPTVRLARGCFASSSNSCLRCLSMGTPLPRQRDMVKGNRALTWALLLRRSIRPQLWRRLPNVKAVFSSKTPRRRNMSAKLDHWVT